MSKTQETVKKNKTYLHPKTGNFYIWCSFLENGKTGEGYLRVGKNDFLEIGKPYHWSVKQHGALPALFDLKSRQIPGNRKYLGSDFTQEESESFEVKLMEVNYNILKKTDIKFETLPSAKVFGEEDKGNFIYDYWEKRLWITGRGENLFLGKKVGGTYQWIEEAEELTDDYIQIEVEFDSEPRPRRV